VHLLKRKIDQGCGSGLDQDSMTVDQDRDLVKLLDLYMDPSRIESNWIHNFEIYFVFTCVPLPVLMLTNHGRVSGSR
jgi:hypothetical protein